MNVLTVIFIFLGGLIGGLCLALIPFIFISIIIHILYSKDNDYEDYDIISKNGDVYIKKKEKKR